MTRYGCPLAFLISFYYYRAGTMVESKQFLSRETLLNAYKEAIKTRKKTREGYIFQLKEEENLLHILEMLKARTYQHDPYKRITITDSKKRYISSPSLRDHIVHHMLYQDLYTVLDKRICHNSFATRRGKWLHKGIEYFSHEVYKYRKVKDLCFMKIDISKYFYSISHNMLKEKLFKIIHNEDIRYTISVAIESYKTWAVFDHLFSPDSFYRQTTNKGLPIGAIYSQLFANFYLYDVDRYVNQKLKPLVYMRYMDDMIFVDTMENLQFIKDKMLQFIELQWLQVVPKKIALNTLSHGINLLWFRICVKDWRIICKVGKNNKKKFWKSIDALKTLNIKSFTQQDMKRIISSIEARKSHFHHTKYPHIYLKDYIKHTSDILVNREKELDASP